MKKTTNYLIVGHGIAGTMIGHFLKEQGQTYCYLDAPLEGASTGVAAGIINPITGRRYVKSWMIDELLPFAKKTYQALEKKHGEQYYHEQAIIRTLYNHGDENTWLARYADDEYRPYMSLEAELGTLEEATQTAFAYAEITKGAQVDIGRLCNRIRNEHLQEGLLNEEVFDFDRLEIHSDYVKYGEIVADQIVFCEGWRGRLNPYFKDLPFEVTKGEVLNVKIPDAELDRMLKHRVYIVPFHEDTYWIGATSDHEFEDGLPSDQNKQFLSRRLEQILDIPFELIAHKAAIRPTVKDRRPFIGRHSEHQRLLIFNGMGTKGASLAPYWANHFVDHLVNGVELDRQVDIVRLG